jgi:hypothetical protein
MDSDRQTTSFNDFSIEAGILLWGNGLILIKQSLFLSKVMVVTFGHI